MAKARVRPSAKCVERRRLPGQSRTFTWIDDQDTRRPNIPKCAIEHCVEVIPIGEVADDDQVAIEQMNGKPFRAARDPACDGFSRKLARGPHRVLQIDGPTAMYFQQWSRVGWQCGDPPPVDRGPYAAEAHGPC